MGMPISLAQYLQEFTFMDFVPEDFPLPEGHTRMGNLLIALAMFVAKQPNPGLAAAIDLKTFPLKRRNFCKNVLADELKAGRIRAWGCIDTTHAVLIRGGKWQFTDKNEDHQ